MEAVMNVSVVTVCFEGTDTLREMIHSLLAQVSVETEHIVIDHGYAGDSVAGLKGLTSSMSHYERMPYAWIYEAMNRGLSLATGDVVAVVNALDLLADPLVLNDVVHALDTTGADAVYGDLAYVADDQPDRMLRYWKSGHWTPLQMEIGLLPPLPAFFARREIFERAKQRNGEYFRASLDVDPAFDIMERFLRVMRISVAYLPRVLTKVRLSSPSNQIMAKMIAESR
jgi:glycosyltransferase